LRTYSPGEDEKEKTIDFAGYTDFLFFLPVPSFNFLAEIRDLESIEIPDQI
jgi:hypothetical protein